MTSGSDKDCGELTTTTTTITTTATEGNESCNELGSRRTALEQLQSAIVDLPNEQTAAYREAQLQCPLLIASESDPVRFLRFCNNDSWKSAVRLCNYWKMRKKVFGDRFCRPLDFTGDGAFEADDVEFMRCGTCTCLPVSPQGRPVAHTDRSRISHLSSDDPSHSKWSFRASFIHMQWMSLHPAAHLGIDIILVRIADRMLTAQHQKYVRAYIHECFPMGPVRDMHIFTASQRRHYFLDRMLPMLISKLIPNFRPGTRFHVVRDLKQGMRQLVEHGFEPEGIPEALGGTWTFDRYDEIFEALLIAGTQVEWTEDGVFRAVLASGPSVKKRRLDSIEA